MHTETYKKIKTLIDKSGIFKAAPTPDIAFENFDFSNHCILITGAAGSIGSTLTTLLTHCKFKKLLLLDNAETPLFFIKQRTKNIANVTSILGDIRDEAHLHHVFKTHKPTLVFHAAAYKHVVLAEENPLETIQTNIFGTVHITKLAVKYNVQRCIFISTDKAVNPQGIMGMTKRIAENYIEQLECCNTQFTSVRFGNIFGSNGSVLPLFLKQLQTGHTINVTHKDATRLFIDKYEACYLILKLTQFETLPYPKACFRMGAPIKIIDLAKVFIEEYNKTYHTAIDKDAIKISALQQGEKLHESVTEHDETLVESIDASIFYIKPAPKQKRMELSALQNLNYETDLVTITALLLKLCGC